MGWALGRRAIRYASVASLLLAGCGAKAPAAADGAPTALDCGVYDLIDIERLPKGVPTDNWTPDRPEVTTPDELVADREKTHRQLQPEETAAPDGSVEAEIRLVEEPRGYGAPQPTHSLVARRVAGVWTLRLGTKIRSGSDPETTAPSVAKTLAAEDGARIDALLADRCLWSAPRFIPEPVPLKAGGVAGCVHGAWNFYDIRAGKARWRGVHFCRKLGPQGDIASALLTAARDKPAPPAATELRAWPGWERALEDEYGPPSPR